MRRVLSFFVTLTLLACGGTQGSDPADAAPSDARADAISSPDGAADAAPPIDGGQDAFDRCKANAGFDLACAGDGVQVIIAGPRVGCWAEKGAASAGIALEIEMDANFAGKGLRLARPKDVGGKDGTVYDFLAPAPIPLQTTPVPKDLLWPAKVVTFAFAGAFSFLEATYAQTELTLDTPLTLSEAGNGKVVTGRFKVKGGAYVRADKNAQRYDVSDPDAIGEGCFRVPSGVRVL